MSGSYQEEIPKARINLYLALHTGGAQKKTELPLKLLTVRDFCRGWENRPLSEREKVNISKSNFDSVGDDLQASHPFRDTKVIVEDIEDKPGFFRVKRFAIPHFQVDGMDVNLSVASQMPKAKA